MLVRTPGELAILQAEIPSADAPRVAAFAIRDGDGIDPDSDDLYRVGTLARVLDVSRRPCCDQWVAQLKGLVRIRSGRSLPCIGETTVPSVCATPLADTREEPARLLGFTVAIRQAVAEISYLFPQCVHVMRSLRGLAESVSPSDFPGVVADLLMHLAVAEQQRLLELEPLSARLEAGLCEIHTTLAWAQNTRRRLDACLYDSSLRWKHDSND